MKEVIEGWIARDGKYPTIGVFTSPSNEPPIWDGQDKVWKPNGFCDYLGLPNSAFQEHTTEMQPRKVRITIETI